MILIGCDGYGWAPAGGDAQASTLTSSAAASRENEAEPVMFLPFD
jgi:hypothetical protein